MSTLQRHLQTIANSKNLVIEEKPVGIRMVQTTAAPGRLSGNLEVTAMPRMSPGWNKPKPATEMTPAKSRNKTKDTHEAIVKNLKNHVKSIHSDDFTGRSKSVDGWGSVYSSHNFAVTPKNSKRTADIEMSHSGTGWHAKMDHSANGTPFTTQAHGYTHEGTLASLMRHHSKIHSALKGK